MNTLTVDNREFAVIDKAIYLQMQQTIEDFEDSRDINKTMLDIKNGDDELLPLDFTKKLLFSGKNKTKLWREYRGLSAVELSTQTNINPSTISLIENNKREPTLSQIKVLASVLSVDIDDLI
jgi:DNA-binding XRE family transcriptional regulator